MQSFITGIRKQKISIEGNEIDVLIKEYEEYQEQYRTDSYYKEYVKSGLKEWEGEGLLDYEIAKGLVGKVLKTEIGTIIITNCDKYNNMINFVGSGELIL